MKNVLKWVVIILTVVVCLPIMVPMLIGQVAWNAATSSRIAIGEWL